jgi:hypothetical protein
MRFRNAGKGEALPSLFPRFAPNTHIYLYASTVHMISQCKEITSFDEPVSVSEFYNTGENGFKRQHNNWREGFPRN